MAGVKAENMPNNTSASENINISMDTSIDDSSRQPRIVFLVLFIFATLIGNICLIIVIVSNKKYRGAVTNVILLNLAVIDLVDCCLNMPLVFGSLLATDWVYGDVMCQVNTFFLNIVIVETVLTLTALTVDRFIAVKIMPSRYGNIVSPSRAYIAITYTWIHSFGFSLPLLSGTIPSTFRQQLHLCSISDSSSIVFICLTSGICFVLPLLTMIVLYVLIFKAVYKDRVAVRSNLAEQSYTEKTSESNQLWKEVDMAKFACVFSCIWIVFEVPYIITTYIKQYQYSREFQENPDIGVLNYPWVVDVTFIWVRFCFSCILPILTFCWKRDFWRTWKDTVLCRRSNSVTDFQSSSNSQVRNRSRLNTGNMKPKEKDKVESPSALTFNVPVLFATESGIHVHTDQGNLTDSEIYYNQISATARSPTDLKILKGKKLDVVSALEFIPPDTSDYDSNSDTEQTDQYSLSQPISTRQLEHHDLDKVSRSSSQPDVQERRSSSRVSSAQPFEAKLTTVSYGTDSGLDLSGTSKGHDVMVLQRSHEDVHQDAMREEVPEAQDNQDKPQEQDSNQSVKPELGTYVINTHTGGLEKPFAGDTSPKSDNAQTESATNDVLKPIENPVQTSLNVTYLSSSVPRQELSKRTAVEPSVLVTKKPPMHLEPLSQTFTSNDVKPPRKRKSKHSKPKEGSDVPLAKNGGKKTSRPGHKRQGTSESQKALLGSSSSAELQDMRTEMLRLEAENKEMSSQTPDSGGSPDVAEKDD